MQECGDAECRNIFRGNKRAKGEKRNSEINPKNKKPILKKLANFITVWLMNFLFPILAIFPVKRDSIDNR